MADSKILDKVSKLLALSESANPNEAAIALARAQKLMKEHALSMSDISLSSIMEQREDVPTILRDKRLYVILASIVGSAFGISYVYNFYGNKIKSVAFIGSKERVPSACYAFTIIARQVAIAKKLFVQQQRQELFDNYARHSVEGPELFYKLYKNLREFYRYHDFYKSQDTYDLKHAVQAYIHGYLSSIQDKVAAFAMDKEEQLLIEEFQAQHYPELSKMRNTKLRFSASDMAHYQQGQIDGQDSFELFHGVNGALSRRELTHKR